MASRKSGHYNSEQYTTSRRGRPIAHDMGFEMFPEKYEMTEIYEDPEELGEHMRDILKDRSPDTTNLFAHEEVRRNKFSRDRLNVRSGGARTNTDPWQNEDFDTQFHDHDPRGWSTDQPWSEYKRHLRKRFEETDFKDDGDYSVTGGGIHPNTLYSRIRGAQNWVKSRLKIFSTAKDSRHNGGIAKYKWDPASGVQKVDFEETSVNIDQRYLDPEQRQHHTTKLSNVIHGGSKKVRVNTTTDHEVRVAAYGKLMRQMGLLPHESQLRVLEDDTRWGKVFKLATTPRPITNLMSSAVEGETAQATSRKAKQAAVGDEEKFKSHTEDKMENRSMQLTNDIVSLLGFTRQDVKFLESYDGENRSQAKHLLANIMELTEMVHATPHHAKLTMRDELAVKAAGGGLRPTNDTHGGQDSVILNPKIVQFMELMVRKSEKTGEAPEDILRRAIPDSEGKLNNIFANIPLYVAKSAQSEDIQANRKQQDREKRRYASTQDTTTQSYKHLSKLAHQIGLNKREAINVQDFSDTIARALGIQHHRGDDRTQTADVNTTQIDVDFGENKALTRHVGRIGTKHMRRGMDTDYFTMDEMNERGNVARRGSSIHL